MKKHIIYRKQTKQVEMISDGKIKYDKSIFAEKEMILTPTKFKELLDSERTLLINGKLILNPRIDKQTKIKELEDELEQITDLDETKQLIKKLINL